MGIENLLARGYDLPGLEMPLNLLAKRQQLEGQQTQNLLAQMQVQQHMQQQQDAQRQRAALQQFQRSIPSPQMQASQAALAGGGGPTAQNAAQMRPVDPRLQMADGAWRAGLIPYSEYAKIANPENKIKDYKAIRQPDGTVSYVGLTDDGRVVQTGQQPFEKPEIKSFGNFMGGIDPITGKVSNFGSIGQSADSVASNATTRRGQDLVDARTRDGLAASQSVYDSERGVVVNKGTGLARPAASFDGKPLATKDAAQKVQDANDVLGILDMAGNLLKTTTGSYAGAAVDQAARAVGVATPGAQSAAQLKALEGMLISKMPKMSGPQSDKDVLLYRQMAGQIGDATMPVKTRQAAIETIRELNKRYAAPKGAAQAAPTGAINWGDLK